jgi:hypothetical protein
MKIVFYPFQLVFFFLSFLAVDFSLDFFIVGSSFSPISQRADPPDVVLITTQQMNFMFPIHHPRLRAVL